MNKRKGTKRHTMIYKTLHIKLTIEQRELHLKPNGLKTLQVVRSVSNSRNILT